MLQQKISFIENNMVTWYGMVWYGMVWYGMVWYGMVWYGMVWYVVMWLNKKRTYQRQIKKFQKLTENPLHKYFIGIKQETRISLLVKFKMCWQGELRIIKSQVPRSFTSWPRI